MPRTKKKKTAATAWPVSQAWLALQAM